MGQKINSNFLRLNYKQYEWFTKYNDKNKEESSLFLFQDLEIKVFLKSFFKSYGMVLIFCKIYRTNSILKIFLSYNITKKTEFLINKTLLISKKKSFFKFCKKSFASKILTSLNLFTKKKLSIFIIFQNINKGLSLRVKKPIKKKSLKKVLLQLKNFKRLKIFNEFLSIFFIILQKKNSSKLLIEFISFQFNKLKKHNFFFNLLFRLSKLMVNSNFSCLYGLKILISGRCNGRPRSRQKYIIIGKIPLQTISANIKYLESVSFTKNGTFGLKLWIFQNKF